MRGIPQRRLAQKEEPESKVSPEADAAMAELVKIYFLTRIFRQNRDFAAASKGRMNLMFCSSQS